MLLTSLLGISALVAGSLAAQSSIPAGAPEAATTEPPSSTLASPATTTETGTGVATHTIAVGASGHKFSPTQVDAKVGDIIEWRFYPTGHWVIRGDFNYPCIPYEYIGTDRTGFSSGPQSVQAITDDGPRFSVRVNDTNPIWFYCGAPGSCVRYHMMGVINPTNNETLEEWVDKAKGIDYQLTPGEPWPTEEGFVTPTDAPGPASTNGSSSGNDDANNTPHNHSSLSGGAIAGIAIGGAAVLLLGAGLIYLCGRRGGFDKAYRKSFRSSGSPLNIPNGPAPGTEARYGSPTIVPPDVWANKQMSPMVGPHSLGHTPISPHPASGYNFPPGVAVGTMHSQDGTMVGSYYDVHGQMITPQITTPPPQLMIPRQEPTPPVELPASADPGNSPLPTYNNSEQPRTFSWAGEETGYRPTKRDTPN